MPPTTVFFSTLLDRLQLLGVLPQAGRGITADAMFTHRDVCDTITHAGGDYILAVKDNQGNLHAALEQEFADVASRSPPELRRREAERYTAATVGEGHGRMETRTLTYTTAFNSC